METQSNNEKGRSHERRARARWCSSWKHVATVGPIQETHPGFSGTADASHHTSSTDLHVNRRHPMDDRTLRHLILERISTLKLSPPFSWEEYIAALQVELARATASRHLVVLRADLGSDTLGRWIIGRRSAGQHQFVDDLVACSVVVPQFVATAQVSCPDTPERVSTSKATTVEWLQVPKHAVPDHLEHIVYHELAHRELGHLKRRRSGRGDGGDLSLICRVGGDGRRERDAEAFATMLMRLAHGWDPGALVSPRLASFFSLLG